MQPTKEELDLIPSIWDGWNKQIFERISDGEGGYCAVGFVAERIGMDYGTAWRSTAKRMAPFLRRNFSLCGTDTWILVEANNRRLMTPDDFRHIDKLTQWQVMQQQIDGIGKPSEASRQKSRMKGGTMNELITDEQILEIEELEEKIAPESSAGFLD